MAPPLFGWQSNKDRKSTNRGTPVVVKMENPNWSMVELEGPSEEDFMIGNSPTADKFGRGRNAKQFTWVLLLKAHKAAGCLTSIASTFLSFGAAVHRRVAAGRTDVDGDTDDGEVDESDVVEASRTGESGTVKIRFYNLIKVFLLVSLVLLVFEVAAYFKGWHFPSVTHFAQKLHTNAHFKKSNQKTKT